MIFPTAFLKSQQGAGLDLPTGGTLFVSVKDSDKPIIVPAGPRPARHRLQGDRDRRHRRLSARPRGSTVERVNKVAQGRPHIVDRIKDGDVDIVFNTTEGWQSHKDSRLDPRLGADAENPLLHHRRVERRGGACDRRAAGTAALKCARSRTIIHVPEHDPRNIRPRSGDALAASLRTSF